MHRFFFLLVPLLLASCSDPAATQARSKIVAVEPGYFEKAGLVLDIFQEKRPLADGSLADCYVIVSKSQPHDHPMGPWVPHHIKDGKEAGGIWIDGGKVYDVDGPFLKNLATFYHDEQWRLYHEDGSIRVTATKEAFQAAARPNVDPRYHNHAVEGQVDWIKGLVTTYVIPVRPDYRSWSTRLGRGAVAVAFNGVKFDPPAPVRDILAAHTIAPFDDHGGHLNPHAGYHYHAALGQSKAIAQTDGHSPLIGYVLDGFPLYAPLDPSGQAPGQLDECGGHFDEVRGYHYHAGAPGSNQIIKAFRGRPGTVKVSGE